MSTSFVHLHTHSHYSLLNALPTVSELVKAAVADGMNALALTDNGSMYGAVEFYLAAQKAGIKPIIGIDAFLAPRTRFDREAQIDKPRARLVLLAKNNEGYRNLISMVTASWTEGFYYRPRIDRVLLEQYGNGLIAIIPSFAGETSRALKSEMPEVAREHLAWYQKRFGDDCYLELTHHPEMPGHEELMGRVRQFAKEHQVPLVAAHDVYYLHPDDRRARETVLKIQSGGTVEERTTMDEEEEDFSFISQATAREYFEEVPEALENTSRIADACNVEIEMKWKFPRFLIESGREPDEELEHLARAGVSWRGLSPEDPAIKERLDYELSVIRMKGYATYFLVVGDLLREARERGILTTIRGSVAGSLTTYVLGITNVNPLDYKLPFERFLNPERPSAPDIDMDYADNRRDEIIEYAKTKYGADKVAQIGTFGTMMARAAVRDVARALGYPYGTGDRIAKLIPMGSQGFPMSIDRALEITPELAELYKKDLETREVIDLAKKIEGKVRHISVHAAGVVISPDPLTHYVPLQPDPKAQDKLITQYDMYTVGEDGVGLLKFDFLGIKNLSILADAVSRVEKIRGVKIDIENVPLNDQKTFEMLGRGETHGLFQLNGSGMTRYLIELRPTRIHDINAMVALYRPGPMESIPSYVERKQNPHLVTYLDPRLKDILSQSYGVITYQDDVMLIAIHLAGYSWLEADKLRKAMGKKIPEEMEAQREKLLKGFVENGMTKDKAERLWKLIEPFAAYGFNKAHAASYGKVAYQTAYMKANYPVEYMAAVLTADAGDVEKIAETISECKRMNIPVLPPDVNESFEDFTVLSSQDDGMDKIRFGLNSIKNFGEGISHAIIEERVQNGRFVSLSNFLERIQNKNLNKKSLESLIKCGALDTFEERGRMLANMDILLAYNREHAAQAGTQDSLFGALGGEAASISLAPATPAETGMKLTWERELLGVYVSGHPLDRFKERFAQANASIAKAKTHARAGVDIVIAGIVEEAKEILTKKGEKMAFLKIADLSDNIEVVAFPKLFKTQGALFAAERCIAVKGKISSRNGTPSMIAEAVKELV